MLLAVNNNNNDNGSNSRNITNMSQAWNRNPRHEILFLFIYSLNTNVRSILVDILN